VTRPSALRVAALCLWLGVVGFGGGFVVAQRVRRAMVAERGWLDDAKFDESFNVACALPGTTAPNLLSIVGLTIGGVRIAAVAVLAFILPSVAMMLAFGVLYDRLRGVTVLASFLDGMAAATVGVVAAVSVDLGRASRRRPIDAALALAAVVLLATRLLNLLEVVALAALIGAVWLRPPAAPPPHHADVHDGPLSSRSLRSALVPHAFALAVPATLALFVVFARISLVTFGGGFAMIPAIAHEVVDVHGWLDESAFNDAMVLGQITPGPIAIAATFIGYKVAGYSGAALATGGMFGPPFVVALAAGRSLTAFRSNATIQGALRGVAPAVVGIVAAAAIALGRTSVHSYIGGAIALAALVVLVRFRRVSPLVALASGGLVFVIARRLS
jgi:chromate transporter